MKMKVISRIDNKALLIKVVKIILKIIKILSIKKISLNHSLSNIIDNLQQINMRQFIIIVNLIITITNNNTYKEITLMIDNSNIKNNLL